jgi:NADH-quinone oxidoreductase subunit N
MYTWLALVGAINAGIAAYYYLRIVGVMYLRSSFDPVRPRPSTSIQLCILICVILTILFGVFPQALFMQANLAVMP